MTQRVPLAPAEASPALRLVVWEVPLLLLVVALVPDHDAPAPHRELLGLAERCHPDTLRQMRWANAKLKESATQALVS